MRIGCPQNWQEFLLKIKLYRNLERHEKDYQLPITIDLSGYGTKLNLIELNLAARLQKILSMMRINGTPISTEVFIENGILRLILLLISQMMHKK